MRFRLPQSNWTLVFWVAVGIFVLTRLVALTAFPIFNDEAIYTQYAQKISDNWQENKYISVDGAYGDWKPPLQYWLGSLFIDWGNDPLHAARAVAFIVSLLGLFGLYLFAKEFFGEREAAIAALLYAICPATLFYNNQFIAETFVFSTVPFVFWAFARATRSKGIHVGYALLGAFLGAALLLFKQSGLLLLALSLLLPFALTLREEKRARVRLESGKREKVTVTRLNYEGYLLRLGLIAAAVFVAYILAGAMVPAEADKTAENFNSRWVMSAKEVLDLPWETWRSNATLVKEYAEHYYTWLGAFFVLIFLGLAAYRRKAKDIILALMLLGALFGVLLLLRGFNEYIPNTAIIIFLLLALSRVATAVLDLPREGLPGQGKFKFVRGAALVLALLMAGHWFYQIGLMRVSPGKYIERSTPWARSNYLTNWPTGFGVKEVVAMLDAENKDGIVFADGQWGNPRTALEIYEKDRYPNLRILGITGQFFDPAQAATFREAAQKTGARYAIFSAASDEVRQMWQVNVEKEMCAKSRREIRAYPAQVPIVICEF